MKHFAALLSMVLTTAASSAPAEPERPLAYINQNLGFNVPGYKYSQSSFPCDIDKELIKNLIEDGAEAGLDLQAVGTPDKIRNGKIPVIAMDIEQLVLGEEFKFGTRTNNTLPKVQVTAAVIKGDTMETAKHTCAIATLNEFTPSSSVLDLGTTVTVCGATRKCLRDLSKDIVDWAAPQIR